MNTAVNGAPAIPSIATGSSKDSTCRPKALRRTVMSMPPKVSCTPSQPAAGLAIRSASRIMPAHEP